MREVVSATEIGQDEVELRAQISDGLPTVRGDSERLRQVLANLVENAVKYSPAGESVDVLATASNGRVQVAVTDHGPGIPADDTG